MTNFETSNIDNLIDYIKPLLKEGYPILISSDCELCYSVEIGEKPDYCSDRFVYLREDYDKDNTVHYYIDDNEIEFVAHKD